MACSSVCKHILLLFLLAVRAKFEEYVKVVLLRVFNIFIITMSQKNRVVNLYKTVSTVFKN